MAENRKVQAARANVEAFRERIAQVTSLEDPMVSNTIWPFPSNGPQGSLIGYMPYETMVTQQFPWLGTLKLRGQAAEAEVQMAVAKLIAAELDVVANVKRGYYDLYLSQRTLQIIETNRSLAEDFIELAGTRYQTGSTSQQDVLRAEVALAELDRERITTQRSLGEAQAELAQQLHISLESELQALDEMPMLQVPAQIDDLYRLATSASPEIQNKLATIVRDERRVELARKKFYPKILVGISYSLMT